LEITSVTNRIAEAAWQTDQAVCDKECEMLGQAIVSLNIEEDDMEYQQQELLLNLVHREKTFLTT